MIIGGWSAESGKAVRGRVYRGGVESDSGAGKRRRARLPQLPPPPQHLRSAGGAAYPSIRVCFRNDMNRKYQELLVPQRVLRIRWIVQQQPLLNGDGQTAIRQKLVMKAFDGELCTRMIAITAEQIEDLELAGDVAHLLSRRCGRARRFSGGRLFIQPTGVHEVLHRLLEGPAAGVQIHIDADA